MPTSSCRRVDWESFGIAALEARTFGLPIVALNDSGVTEFVRDGHEGLLAADDRGDWRGDREPGVNPDLRTTMTHRNTTIEPEFGWPTIVSTTDDRYRDAMRLLR